MDRDISAVAILTRLLERFFAKWRFFSFIRSPQFHRISSNLGHKNSFEVVKIHIEVHLQTFHGQRTRGRMARRCQIWDRSNFPDAAGWVNKMGNLLFNPFFSRRVWSVAWQCLFYEPFSGGHCNMLFPMSIDIFKILKSKNSFLAHFLTKKDYFYCRWCKSVQILEELIFGFINFVK